MIKNLVYLAFPYQVSVELLIIGLLLLWTSKYNKIGRRFVTASVLLIILFGNEMVPSYLIKNLESKYPTLEISKENVDQFAHIRYIVVLGAMPNYMKQYPLTSQVGGAGLLRLVEGISLHRALNGTKLILSGGGQVETTEAELMYRLALKLGVNEKEIIIEKESTNTYEEVKYIKEIVRNDDFVVVTSARHMLRAMALFEKYGMNPIPAPTAHSFRENKGSIFSMMIPRPVNLNLMNAVMYEYYGMIKARLLGRL